MRHALLQRQHPQLPHVVAEVAGERPVRPRVRLRALQDAVRAARVHPVAHDRPYVLLVAHVLEDRRGEPVLQQQLPRHRPRALAARPRRLQHRTAHVLVQRRVAHPGDLDRLPLHRHAVAAVRAGDLQVVPDPLRRRLVREPPQDLLGAALARPARQQRHQGRAARGVRIGVQRDVGARVQRLVQQRQQLGRPALVHPEVHGGVRQMQRAARLPREGHHLRVRLQRAGAVGAVVRAVVAAVRRHHPAQLGQFGVRGVHPGRVRQPRRHPDRTLLHALRDQLPHPVQLFGRGLAVLPADGERAHRALRDQVRRVHRDAPVQPVQVLADRPPVEVHVVTRAVPPGDRLPHLAQRPVVHRRVRQPVLAEHFEGDALRGLRAVVGVAQQGEVAVRVHVDEAGGQHQPLRVQFAPRLRTLAARVRRFLDDGDDASAVHHHVRAVRVVAGAVDDVRVPDDELFHGPAS